METYDEDLKARLIKEAKEVKNVALVARKYNIPKSTLQTWVSQDKKDTPEKRAENEKALKIKELEKNLEARDLEIVVLKDLLKKSNQLWLSD